MLEVSTFFLVLLPFASIVSIALLINHPPPDLILVLFRRMVSLNKGVKEAPSRSLLLTVSAEAFLKLLIIFI